MDSLLELFQTIADLICIYGISKLALSKKLKSFHIHFSEKGKRAESFHCSGGNVYAPYGAGCPGWGSGF